ncbi:hypothetical protein [Streptomyces sp. NPDC088789]|uniref:hypothetical protein n=1 Tax=Streptomyces sp. NPDC088789 TaxID=3365899 RepID=UPI00382F3291
MARPQPLDTRRALLLAEPCTVSVTHATTRITWTTRPVTFLPLAYRQGTELPPDQRKTQLIKIPGKTQGSEILLCLAPRYCDFV